MGGRIYDAEIGRFLQADPFVQDRTNSQALNRYSYVLNNPLSYTDPSGFFLKKLFKKIKKAIGKVFKAIRKLMKKTFRAIGRALNAVPGLSVIVGAVICNVNAACWAAFGKIMAGINAAVTLANGGTIGDVLKGAAIGAISARLGNLVASPFHGLNGEYFKLGDALGAGIASKASGQKFIDGIKGYAIAQGVRTAINKVSNWVQSVGEKKAEDGGQDIKNSDNRDQWGQSN